MISIRRLVIPLKRGTCVPLKGDNAMEEPEMFCSRIKMSYRHAACYQYTFPNRGSDIRLLPEFQNQCFVTGEYA